MSDQTVLPRLVWPGRAHDEPELDQPLMVVVLVVLARAAVDARTAGAVFRVNGRAANIGCNCSGSDLFASTCVVSTSRRGVVPSSP